MKSFQEYVKESTVSRTVKPTVKFIVKGPNSFDELLTSPEIKKRSGPNTNIFDASDNERVKKAQGGNKMNALVALYSGDFDEIACAMGGKAIAGGFEWFCLAVNVEI